MGPTPSLRRFLVISLSNIGDAVLTTPVLEALHAYCAGAIIDIVADPRSAELFLDCPYRGEVFEKRKREGWRGLVSLIRRLRRQRYELIVDLRTDGMAYLLRANRRYTRRGARPAGSHAVQRHMGVIHALCKTVPDTTIWLNPDVRRSAEKKLAPLGASRLLSFAPGANWPGKIWASHKYQALANQLTDIFDAVVLLGGREDTGLAAQVAAGLHLPCLDLCGRTGLREAAAVIEKTTAFVGNDSGLGHLAAAVRTPSLTVFGPGVPERYHPWGPAAAWIAAGDRSLESLTVPLVRDRLLVHLQKLNKI